MEEAMPRPPWLRRLPSGVWAALTWCAAGLFAALLYAVTVPRTGPLGLYLRQPLAFGGALRVLVVVLALPVGWARRRPLAVFGVLLAESCLCGALGVRNWPHFLVLSVLIGILAATRPRRTALVCAGAELAVWGGQWAVQNLGQETSSDLLSMLSAWAAVIAIAWLVGNSVRQQRVYGEALRAQAVTAERLRIARELHDVVAHSMGVIAFQAGAAGLVLETQPANARKALGAIETTSRETLAGLRRMLVSLRRADGDPSATAAAVGLEALDRLAETTTEAGVKVEVDRQGPARPLSPDVDLAAFRIIQEAVTNTVRHAGAGHCRIQLSYREKELAIEVTDDGHGARRSSAGSGYGISGMRERVALLGGRFSAGSRPEGGFRVAAELPL